uniref:Uncharacterized protein n=1 Tax=Dunaliella tertiolecta TaxID=3047 RepID=A0A7S3VPD6_DUNTE
MEQGCEGVEAALKPLFCAVVLLWLLNSTDVKYITNQRSQQLSTQFSCVQPLRRRLQLLLLLLQACFAFRADLCKPGALFGYHLVLIFSLVGIAAQEVQLAAFGGLLRSIIHVSDLVDRRVYLHIKGCVQAASASHRTLSAY